MRDPVLVDVGAGYGSLIKLVADMLAGPYGALGGIARYIAIDKSAAQLLKALDRARLAGFAATGYLYDLDDEHGVRPDNDIGDIIVLSYVLSHVRNIASVLRLVAAIAKAGATVLVIDADYAAASASGDPALIRTVEGLRGQIRHTGLANCDALAAEVGLRRVTGIFDGVEEFGPLERSAKDGLAFCSNFTEENPIRADWEAIMGGTMSLRQIRRLYVRDA